MSEFVKTCLRSLGLLLFLVALALISVFWPFGGGIAQTLLEESIGGGSVGAETTAPMPDLVRRATNPESRVAGSDGVIHRLASTPTQVSKSASFRHPC